MIEGPGFGRTYVGVGAEGANLDTASRDGAVRVDLWQIDISVI